MGKYDQYKNYFDNLKGNESVERREEIDIQKKIYKEYDQKNLMRTVAGLKGSKKNYEDLIKGINIQYEALTEVIEELFEEEQLEKLAYKEIGSLTVSYEPYCSTTDKPSAIRWLVDNGLGDIVREDFAWQTFNSMVKERILEGQMLPSEEDGVKIFMRTKLNFRK